MQTTKIRNLYPLVVNGAIIQYPMVMSYALEDVSLDIKAGEFITLVGPSGSGKTTLLMAIAGFVSPDQGSIYFGQQEMTMTPPHMRGLGMVFQNYALFPFMSVAENVGYPLRVRGMSETDQKKKIDCSS